MAIKINEPIGPAGYGPMFCRCAIGGYFLLAGLSKLHVLPAFVAQVQTFGILPANISSLYGVLLPYIEIFIGGCFMVGLWTTMVGIMAGMLLISFICAFGLFPESADIFNKDVVLLGAVLGLLYTGPGSYSLDNIRRPAALA